MHECDAMNAMNESATTTTVGDGRRRAIHRTTDGRTDGRPRWGSVVGIGLRDESNRITCDERIDDRARGRRRDATTDARVTVVTVVTVTGVARRRRGGGYVSILPTKRTAGFVVVSTRRRDGTRGRPRSRRLRLSRRRSRPGAPELRVSLVRPARARRRHRFRPRQGVESRVDVRVRGVSRPARGGFATRRRGRV